MLIHKLINNLYNFSDCSDVPSLPSLPSGISCHLDEDCSGFECCLNVSQINRTVAFYMHIDICNNNLSVGIENLIDNQAFVKFPFGK